MKNGEYILVVAPESYPGTKYRGKYCYEHHLVWYLNTGEVLSSEHLIHHKDRNKHNNSFCNLEKQTKAEHVKEHASEKHLGYLTCYCVVCSRGFTMSVRNFKSRSKENGHTDFCCSRSCQVKKQHRDKVAK